MLDSFFSFLLETVTFSQLKSEERKIFAGLDRVKQEKGRIYKRLKGNGEYLFFRAQSFFSEIYHFIFSERLKKEDIITLEHKVYQWIEQSSHPSSKLRVEAAFERVIHQIEQNSLGGNVESWSMLLREPHLSLIKSVAIKMQNRTGNPLQIQQKEETLRQEDLAILTQFLEMPLKWKYTFPLIVSEAAENLKDKHHPVTQALKTLQEKAEHYCAVASQLSQAKAQRSSLSIPEIEEIIRAKADLAAVQISCGGYLNVESFRLTYPGLDHLFLLAQLANEQILQACADGIIIGKVVQYNGLALQFASEDLRKDREIAKRAVEQNGKAFAFVLDSAKGDFEVVKAAFLQASNDEEKRVLIVLLTTEDLVLQDDY